MVTGFNQVLISKLMVVCVIGLLAITYSTNLDAKNIKRGDKWEGSFKILDSESTEIDGQGGSNINLKGDFGWGFTVGYHLNSHILINYDFSSTSPSYKATYVSDNGRPTTVNEKMDLYESQFNVVYNILQTPFTPYIQAGAGWSYIDSNVASNPPVGGCWYDPWWGGLRCDSFQDTYDDTRFSYNVAVGLRYDLPNSAFLRLSYRESWIDLSNSNDVNTGSYHFEIGSFF